MVSVIIAAYNEESVLGACLESLLKQDAGIPIEIIVSANGCTDRTADVAMAHGVKVIDHPIAGKAGALNAADQIASSFPRVYLDADIVLPNHAIREITNALTMSDWALAATPRRRIDTRRRSILVKAYFAINEQLPVFRNGLFGRGVIAVSERGRARFGPFPEMIADDLFVDSQFSDSEKIEVSQVEVVVAAPYSTKALLARLVRVRRGNAQLRAAGRSGEINPAIRPSDRWAWLREVVIPKPYLALAAIPYVGITLVAAIIARRSSAGSWAHDQSTRTKRIRLDSRTM